MEDEQKNLRGLLMALAIDFGTRAKNAFASMEAMDEADYPSDAGELEAASKVWTTAAGQIWSLLGTEPAHGADNALVRIGLSDLAKLLTKSEQQTSEIAMLNDAIEGWRSHASKLETQLAGHPLMRSPFLFAPTDQQDILSLYIAGGSSERLTVGRPWIDRAIAEGACITYDWTRTPNYDVTRPGDASLRADAERDVLAVACADILWILVPQQLSEGAGTELGVALGDRARSARSSRRIVVSGEHARRNIFALLADEIYETHEEAWESLKPRVIGAVERGTT